MTDFVPCVTRLSNKCISDLTMPSYIRLVRVIHSVRRPEYSDGIGGTGDSTFDHEWIATKQE